MTNPEPLEFLVFNAAGLSVTGTHRATPAPVHHVLVPGYNQCKKEFEHAVLSKPGGFNGPRAALTAFRAGPGHLHVETQYRTYVEGLALRQGLRLARERGSLRISNAGLKIPDPSLSWGLSLSTYMLLPQGFALCAQRSPLVTVSPGLWTMSHSEVVEPADISEDGMLPLLHRLVAEEASALQGLGIAKFVGLAVRPLTYAWQLVAVIDLRNVALQLLTSALANLQPDVETSAWSVVPLESTASSEWLGSAASTLLWPAGRPAPADLDIAQYLSQKVTAC